MKKVYILFLTILLGIFSFSMGNAAVLFQDNFNDSDYDGWTHIRSVNGTLYLGDWTVTIEGYLQCIPSGDAQNLQLDLPTLPESYVLEFDTRTLVDGGGASLIGFYVHWDTWDDRVEVGYRPGRVYIRQYVDGSSVGVLFADPAPEPDPSEWHHFKFVKEGALCSLYIDGASVLDYELPVSVTGGSLVLAGSPGTHQFDNVVITTEETPTDLEERVDALELQLEMLRQQFTDHSHIYLTGKGEGHNNTEATTGPPVQP